MRSCPNCSSKDLVRISMSLAGGPVDFAHCPRCEHRWWMAVDGRAPLPLNEVLDMARTAA